MKKEIYWHDKTRPKSMPELQADTEAEFVIIGGGMAGLSAAQWLREEADADTLVLESQHCGAGASGHNSGNIMPDAFIGAHYLLRRFGEYDAKLLALSATAAVQKIQDTSERYGIDCERMDNGALYVASNAILASDIKKEHRARQQLGLPSAYYDSQALRDLLGSSEYHAGIGYGGTLGINSYQYILSLRDALVQRGLRVHENTPALGIEPGKVITPNGVVKAKHVLVCVDRFAPSLGIEREAIYHQQHHLAVSEPLDETVQRQLFPQGNRVVHGFGPDFHYYRLTPDGRLVIGGMLLRQAYREQSQDLDAELESLVAIIRKLHPVLGQVRFSHGWSGKFGVTKDMLPIAGKVSGNRHGAAGDTHAALCAGSMAWSLLAGQTAAQVALSGSSPLDRFFAPHRAYTPLDKLTSRLDKSVAFPLSHLYSANVLKGTPEQVSRHQQWVRVGAWSLAVGAALYLGNRWLKSRSRNRY